MKRSSHSSTSTPLALKASTRGRTFPAWALSLRSVRKGRPTTSFPKPSRRTKSRRASTSSSRVLRTRYPRPDAKGTPSSPTARPIRASPTSSAPTRIGHAPVREKDPQVKEAHAQGPSRLLEARHPEAV